MLTFRFRQWPILFKIMAISVISVTFITLVILLYFTPLIEQKIMEGKKDGIKNVVDLAFAEFREQDALVKSGELSVNEAKVRLIERIKTTRYNDTEYFWINDLHPRMIMHPIKPDLDGTDLTDNKDPNGKFLFRAFVAICKNKGAGYVDYMWPKPGEDKPVPKISYVRLYEPWGWIIGSGIYLDDVKKDMIRLRTYMLAATCIFTMVTITFAVLIGTGITRPLKKVIGGLQDIASGKGGAALTKRIAITSIDEIGMLSSEFNSLMESINNLTVFKKVIEEDDNIEEVYQRLGEVFTGLLGVPACFIFEVVTSRDTMRLVYPSAFDQSEMQCNHDILEHAELCKARRTGHVITSSTFPGVCRQFITQEDKVHYCFPIIVSGGTVGVVQFIFTTPKSIEDAKAMETKAFKAEQYVSESLAVIETKRLMSTLRESALTDPLTGLNNRRYLQEYTEKIVAGIIRRGKKIGLIMCDLDYFKQVNDTCGHSAGDMVLKEISVILRKSVRDSDIVIRFGGEEFLAVLLDINEGESMMIAEKIRSQVEQCKIKLPDRTIQKTISLGVSEFPVDTSTLWSCIKFADVALYRAKEQGRNRAVRFTADMWKDEQV